LARRFGVTESQVSCLLDKGRAEFPRAEEAALRYAEELTRNPQSVGEATFEELRRHWNEAQIVEITAVAGLFNYFNRFNNALGMEPTVYPVALDRPPSGCA
jgi:alkylhydroperoxidase family enzyme